MRCKEEESRELFAILDFKKDGILDYEEFCSLVPNKLELEMIHKNEENP